MKKKSMTIEDLAHVNIPVKLNGVKHTIRSLKPFGIGNDLFSIEIRNESTNKTDYICAYTKEYNTCVRAVNRWIQKELRK